MKVFISIIYTLSAVWDLSQWWLFNEQCAWMENDTLVMECMSTGLVSNDWYQGSIAVSVEVKATAIGNDSRYWAGLALNADIHGDDKYVQAAITYQIDPYHDWPEPVSVLLATTGRDCCQVYNKVDSGWHTLKVYYDGSGYASVSIDGVGSGTPIILDSYQIELLCIADNPNTPNTGALTRCEWRNLILQKSDSIFVPVIVHN